MSDEASVEQNVEQDVVKGRGLMEEWKERQYMAFVNFLRKKGMFDDWKMFKSKYRGPLERAMLEFLKRAS